VAGSGTGVVGVPVVVGLPTTRIPSKPASSLGPITKLTAKSTVLEAGTRRSVISRGGDGNVGGAADTKKGLENDAVPGPE
jgi:hypothetical protein